MKFTSSFFSFKCETLRAGSGRALSVVLRESLGVPGSGTSRLLSIDSATLRPRGREGAVDRGRETGPP